MFHLLWFDAIRCYIIINFKTLFIMEKIESHIKTTPFILEIVEQGENKVTFILRNAMNNQVLCLADSADELCSFLTSLTS